MTAIGTGGTAATTTLTSLIFNRMNLDADIAVIANGIKNDQNVTTPTLPGAFARNGRLYVPNRGILTVLPGDLILLDTVTGWPILVSKLAAADASWVHSP